MSDKRKVGNVLTWASTLDDKALDQAKRTAALPFLAGHLALMPDAHWGMGSTIGSVIPTMGAIIPAAVGVDIGCGMIATELSITAEQLPDTLDPLHAAIGVAVPAGVGKGHDDGEAIEPNESVERWGLEKRAMQQTGTLGSGNHFIEVCLDEFDKVWVVIHSGSRGVGNKLAMRHIATAKKMMAKYFITLDDPDLAYFVQGTPEFKSYLTDLMWAQKYAANNRTVMMANVLDALSLSRRSEGGVNNFTVDQTINCHHNYTAMEHHHGKDMWITRKGAISARVGQLGIIPGSMGTDTFIVEGLGNPASYDSAPHGAGRAMSRTKARKTLDVETLDQVMEGKAWNRNAKGLIDEDPRAYKPIEVVMRDSADLVTPVRKLRQILNFKGD